MDAFEGASESAKGGVGEVRNNVVDSYPSNNNNSVVTQTSKQRRKLTSAFVEYAGIRQLFNYVCADIKLVSRNTAKADVLSLYNREKPKLKEILDSVLGRKRILNFSFMPPLHTGIALYEWGKLEKLSEFLKVFYDMSCLFFGTKYPTANLYFPQVLVVEDTLKKAKVDSDSFMKSMATQMMEKFDKYWKEYSLILAIAVILDPRYKI
ncbi:hypothetical protein L3X38_042002 [Prunus dulcis]|uniref:hAT-like transposase RNase-H fold domain-containing protein n=1 Tax=Prunus dulcis TaxID=3755 RepID=A0AAD4UUC7_PRUDU|nr:hypothetical protein L3X38_042002 [Prunus dulcis]